MNFVTRMIPALMSTLSITALGIAALATTPVLARDQIRVVGSSTVFPFSTSVAEQFGNTTDFPTPVVEATGSGGGIKLFCAGVGTGYPDIANASRRMKAKEFAMCQDNGVSAITEAVVGFDGIVVANAREGLDFELGLETLWEALAADGDLPETWDEIDPALPMINIEVLGPPPSSGTRDAFEELVMQPACLSLGKGDKAYCKGAGRHIREDGPFVEAGENDNLIVSKLEANPDALGVFGFSFLDQNGDAIKGALIDDVEPTFDNIAGGAYPVSRSLYFYLKNAHVGVIPGLQHYAVEFLSEDAAGEDGYLLDKGLIPLNDEMFATVSGAVGNLTPLDGEDLE